MKTLKELFGGIDYVAIHGDDTVSISYIIEDSREVKTGALFVAIKGTKVDSHIFIDQVVEQGASVIVCEVVPENIKEGVTYVEVKDSKYALGMLASHFYDNPSSKLKLVGVTGTNGKTTTATLLYQLFKKLGYKVGLLSTVKNIVDEQVVDASLTTPNPTALHKLLKDMVDAGCTHACMEVSSHAAHQKRIAGLQFAGGIFTNLTQDHLDYHETMDAYGKAKKLFFDGLPKDAFALSNIDDPWGEKMIAETFAHKYFYTLQKDSADFSTVILKNNFSGTTIELEGKEIEMKLIGAFNVYNMLAVYGAAVLLGEEKEKILNVIPELLPVDGRFQYVQGKNEITGIVDYAHTPDALEKILRTVKNLKQEDAKLITVFGCGGNRDATKRPIMGHIAGELSDIVIVTSDNPRNEEPEAIIRDIRAGIDMFDIETKKYFAIIDRHEAIAKALLLAEPHDVIVVAGKGHETYQEIKGIKTHFDDLEELKKLL